MVASSVSLCVAAKQILRRRSLVWYRCYHEVSYATNGEPLDVLEYRSDQFSHHEEDTIQLLAAPWNPADVNTVQGKYPDDPSRRRSPLDPSRSIAGAEAIARLPDGSIGVSALPGGGTLRSQMPYKPQEWVALKRGKELWEKHGPSVACLFQVGGTAWQLIRQRSDRLLGPVIQNAGNSAVGFMVHQLLAALYPDVTLYSVVRARTDPAEYEMIVSQLSSDTHSVLTEDEMSDRAVQKALNPPALALNAVGGESASNLMRVLAKDGVHITYGGLSMQPVTVPTPYLIFRNIRVQGYWHSAWMKSASMEEKKDLMDGLVDLILDDRIQLPPTHVVGLKDFKEGLSRPPTQGIRSKLVFDLTEE